MEKMGRQVVIMNRIELKNVEPEECFVIADMAKILESYAAYLTDESRSEFKPVSAIYFPENTAQVVDAVLKIRARNERIVVSASRTGITGGAVGVDNASIISLEKMIGILGDWSFQAGVKLEDIPLSDTEFYPVDPTEMTASIGGTVATDASGARTFHYGSTRCFIRALTVVLADGRVLEIERGSVVSSNGEFVLTYGDETLVIPVVDINMPPVKNTAGYFLKKEMDLIDLFIGSEGTLGVVTEISTKVSPLPADRLYLVVYTKDEQQALGLVERVKADSRIKCLAIEYFDPNSITLLRVNEALPNLPPDAGSAVYLEILMDNEDVEQAIDDVLTGSGLTMDSTWAGFEDKDLVDMKHFRHMVPETVNTIIGRRKKDIPGLHKIGTDTAVPEGKLREFLMSARSAIEGQGIEYVIFGHIGDNHLHINMLPATIEDLSCAKKLYREIAEESVRLGGSVSAEHGIGRLKKHFMEIQFNSEELNAMRAVKNALDPDGILNPGVMI